MQKNLRTGRGRAAGRAGALLMAALILAAAPPFEGRIKAVYGAESSVIETLNVSVKTTFGEQEEIPVPEIQVTGNGCTQGDIQYGTDYDKWKPGKAVKVDITVHANSGKVFPVSLNRSKCKVSGAEFISAKALDDTTLQVRINYRPVTVLGNTEKAGWSSSKRRAIWKKVPDAPGYSVVLYGNDKVVKRLTVEDETSVSLAQYMEDVDKTYYYEVKAIPITADQKKYLKEGEFVTSTEQELDWEDWNENTYGSSDNGSGGGPGDGGAIKGNNYVLPDGRTETNTWKKISNEWYYFDQNGNMARGWQNVNGFWYYMDGNGIMQTGWVNPSGDSWFYLNPNGDMLTGWFHPNPNDWYYMDSSGYMQRGWIQVDDKQYYMGQDGKMMTGWVQVDGQWYYLNSDGSKAVNTVVDGRSLGPNGEEIR